MASKALAATLLSVALAPHAAAQVTPGPVGGTDAAVEAGVQAGFALIATFAPTSAGSDPRPTPTPVPSAAVQPDGSSVDTVIAALYESVSHGPEYEPNWARMRNLFLPTGKLIPPKRPDASTFTVLDFDGFRTFFLKGTEAAKQRGDSTAFLEIEVARTLDCFGNVCQAFSTYESRHAPADPKPFASGINSIQLVNDGKRWWIASVAWDTQRPDGSNPIPAAYSRK
jgi:hypothetical protein